MDGEDMVPGELIAEGTDGWIGVVDWTRLETVEAWPEAATTGIREGQ